MILPQVGNLIDEDELENDKKVADFLSLSTLKKRKRRAANKENKYSHLENKYPVGKKVAFKMPGENRIVLGEVIQSYFRINSKSPKRNIFEQLAVSYKNVIYFKTATVLDKYNK